MDEFLETFPHLIFDDLKIVWGDILNRQKCLNGQINVLQFLTIYFNVRRFSINICVCFCRIQKFWADLDFTS